MALGAPAWSSWNAFPSAKPATSCFPFTLHDTQLTPPLRLFDPFPPVTNSRVCRFAIMRCPLVSTTATECASSGAGLGASARTATFSVPIMNAGFGSDCWKESVAYTASPPPFSAQIIRNDPSEVKTTCERRGTSIVRALEASKGLMPFSAFASASKAARTFFVSEMTRAFGPAAARSPLRELMLKREDVDVGRASIGHGDGSSLILVSPANALKPMD
jgi:hypothetical protein